jgi:phage terminase small subunit
LFLEHLAKTANVTASARKAGFDLSTAYQHRLADPEFAAHWEDPLEQSVDDLEGEARLRRHF